MFNAGTVAVNGAPQQRNVDATTLVAPIGGMNALDSLAQMPQEDCIFTYNLMPSEFGVRTRLGNTEWANAFTGGDIRTIIPYSGDREDLFNDRLFALNDTGIYNISASGPADPAEFTWATVSGNAGYAIYTHYTNDAGAHFLMMADEQNGLHEYEEATDTWSLTTGITGPVITDIVHISAHKKRLWMVEKNSSSAWYLPTGAKAGAATEFNFGAQFREGGPLVGLWSWTVDGGDGVDDYLVALSRAGGVAVYRGTDPANASTWGLVGVWYIGRVPVGHKVASEYGGTLYMLSEYGILNIGELLRGSSVADATLRSTDKITRLIRTRMATTLNIRGWEIRTVQPENSWVVIAPPASLSDTPTQFVRNLTTNGWGFWRGMAMQTGDVWQSAFYWADNNGSVWKHSGFLEGVLLDGTPGVAIEFSMLMSYQNFGAPAMFKRVQNLRPYFLSAGVPSFSIQAHFDYDILEGGGVIIFNPVDAALWDEALWDSAVWGGGISSAQALRGGSGIGVVVGVALRGDTTERLTFVAVDIIADAGGFI
jgi:hypothetical protein